MVDVPSFGHDDNDKIREHLPREGDAIVENNLNTDELTMAHDLFWDRAESISCRLSRHDSSTSTSWPVALDGGIMPWQGSGQSDFAMVRANATRPRGRLRVALGDA
jgi:hypothetical protein